MGVAHFRDIARLGGWLAALALAGLLGSGTALAAAPTTGATWTTGITATAADLHAEVNPGGLDTYYHFQYLTRAAYLANGEGFAGASRSPASGEAFLGFGTSYEPALQHVGGLSPSTAYEYRIVATNSSSPPGGTPGEARSFTTRESSPVFALPDSRAWELVSPLDKNGGAIQAPEGDYGGGVLEAAAQGNGVTYSSTSSFGAGAAGAPSASQYLSTRTEAGWSTENLSAPTVSGAYGAEPNGVPYQLFAADLARGVMLNGRRCGESEPCPRSYSLWEAGAFSALPEAGDPRFEGASPDLRHLVFATEGGLEEWSGGGLAALSAVPGAALAAQGAGAVSEDGSRVYFSAGGNLYLRDGGTTYQVDAGQGGGGSFEAATPGGEIAFFSKGEHLYRYLTSTHAAADLTAGGGVEGVLGISSDGASAYFKSNGGSLLPPGSEGIYRWHEGSGATKVVSGAGAAQPSDWPPTTGTARVSADGETLLFLSRERLTGYENTDQATGEADSEVFLWRGGAGLLCLSCNPTNERPAGPSTIPGAYANGKLAGSTDSYKPRVLSQNGRRAFFDSADGLLARDSNSAPDVYQWEAGGEGSCPPGGGCLSLISSGRSAEGAAFTDASATGADAFFTTDGSLVPADPGSVDVYDARVGGGLPEPPAPIACEGDACQTLPPPPEDPTVGTSAPSSGNPPVHSAARRCPKGKRLVRRHGRAVCVKKKHKKRGHR